MLGPEDPSTLTTRSGLADTLDSEGKYVEAETEYRTVVRLKGKVKGPENPDTLGSRSDLGNALLHQGKYADAETKRSIDRCWS
ncbi:MAG: tetratricopeptide repeat protein [Chthoniobacterales bacterium]